MIIRTTITSNPIIEPNIVVCVDLIPIWIGFRSKDVNIYICL